MKQITTGAPGRTTLVAQACANVQGFSDMYRRFKRRMKTSGRSESTLNNYKRHIGQMARFILDACLPIWKMIRLRTICTCFSSSTIRHRKATSSIRSMDCVFFFVWMVSMTSGWPCR
jgi:site-specific recombinase XerC